MAYFTKTSEKITPNNFSARVKSITVCVCVTNCTGTIYRPSISPTFSSRAARSPPGG